MEDYKIEIKDIKKKINHIEQKQEHCSLRERLPYICSYNSYTENSKVKELKQQINGFQGLVKSINDKVKQKQQSLSILMKQSIVHQMDKENKNRIQDQLHLIRNHSCSNQDSQLTKKRNQDMSLIILQSKSKQSPIKIDQQKYQIGEQQKQQNNRSQRLRTDQLQYQELNLFTNIHKLPVQNSKLRGFNKNISKQLQMDSGFTKNKEDDLEFLQKSLLPSGFPKRRWISNEKYLEQIKQSQSKKELVSSLSSIQQSDYGQNGMRNKCHSSINIKSECKNYQVSIFDNQIILKLIQNASLKEKENKQEQLKECLQKCNQQIKKAKNSPQAQSVKSQHQLFKSNSTIYQQENLQESELSLPERVRKVLNIKKQQQNDNAQKVKDQDQNESQKHLFTESQQYFYAPKLIQRYQDSNNGVEKKNKQKRRHLTEGINDDFFMDFMDDCLLSSKY